MAVNVLGRAYIEVHADTKPFGKELKESVTAITKLVEKESQSSGRNVGRGLGEGMEREVKRTAPAVARGVARVMDREMTKVGRGGHFFSRLFSGGDNKGILGSAAKLGGQAAGSFASAFGAVVSEIGPALGKTVTQIGSSVGNVGGNGPLGAIIAVGLVALAGAAVALVSVLGPLLNVVGLLPGAFAIAGAAILPVVVAFQDFGEAISAIMSGDPKKIALAMKALSPAAQGVAKNFQAMLPFLKELKRQTQESFFSKLAGVLPRIQAALGPTLLEGMKKVAAAAGEFFRGFLLLAENPLVKQFFANVFEMASFTFKTLGGPINSLIASLAAISSASFPTLKVLISGFGLLVKQFSDFLLRSIADGSFQKFLDSFMMALGNLSDLFKAGLNFVDALIGGPENRLAAQQFFDTLVSSINVLADFFRSELGQESLRGMIELANMFVIAIVAITLTLGVVIAMMEKILKLIRQWILMMPDPFHLLPDRSNAKASGIGFSSKGSTGGSGQIASAVRSSTAGFFNGSGTFGRSPGHATGGIFDSEHLARIAEGGRREVVIPLTDRKRAMELADRSGLTSMMNSSDVSVNVYIGDEQIQARVDSRVATGIKGLTSSMRNGPRPVGIGG